MTRAASIRQDYACVQRPSEKKKRKKKSPCWCTTAISQTRAGIRWTTCLMLALTEPVFVYSRAFSSSSEHSLVGAWMKSFAKEESKQEGFRSSGALYYMQNHSHSSDVVCIPFQFRAVCQLLRISRCERLSGCGSPL